MQDLNSIKTDNLSGSTELLINLNEWFIENHTTSLPSYKLLSELENHFDQFQSIINYLKEVRELTSKNSQEIFNNYVTDFRNRTYSALNLLFTNVYEEIKPAQKILTISNSYQILYVLKKYSEYLPGLKVTVCESRPQFEGRILAEKLARSGINTILITEASISGHIVETDCVLVGADKVLANGNVINKIGSKLLAISAKHYNKPFMVVSDKSKFSIDSNFQPKSYNSDEIWHTNQEIIIENYYFEEIENDLISKVISNFP